MILALKTSDDTAQLWLYDSRFSAEPLAELTWQSGRQLADQLLASITEFLASQARGPADLEGLIIYSGPGSFTSLRIGHSVANALADSLGVPVAGATGTAWAAAALKSLEHTPAGQSALPHYGAEANITKPKT